MAHISWERVIQLNFYAYIRGRCTIVEITILSLLLAFGFGFNFDLRKKLTALFSLTGQNQLTSAGVAHVFAAWI